MFPQQLKYQNLITLSLSISDRLPISLLKKFNAYVRTKAKKSCDIFTSFMPKCLIFNLRIHQVAINSFVSCSNIQTHTLIVIDKLKRSHTEFRGASLGRFLLLQFL